MNCKLITEETHPDIWKIILKILPEYPYKEARLWKKDYMGLVARYNDQGWMCTYYLIQNNNIERIPDKLDDDFPTEFLDIPKGAIGISTGIYPNGISVIDVFRNDE